MSRSLLIIILFSLLTSCEEECTGDCAEILITGQVTNALNNQGIAKVPIQVNWQESGFGFFNTTLKFANTKTNKQGQFKISKTIDKAKFEDYFLKVEADIPNGFIDNYAQNDKITSYIIRYEQVRDIRMAIYPEARLSIKLVKNQQDNFNFFDLTYSYHKPFSAGGIRSDGGLTDTTYNVKTAADIYTIIEWKKNYGIGQNVTFVDSIMCSSSKDNIFLINY